MVNFSSAESCPNKAVQFTRSNDKELFDKPTRVHYKYAEVIQTSKLINRANSKDIVSDYRQCKEKILKAIICGAFKSEFTSYEILDELKIHYPKLYTKYYPQGHAI
jgi:hypothetical protein